jgi:hypothetical protein
MLVMAVVLIGGCASSGGGFSIPGYNFSDIDKIAIVTVEGAIESESAKNQIADLFAAEFLKKGFAPLERTQVKAKLEEQQLQSSELITEVGTAEIGKILNVPAVLIVIIPHFGKEISMTAKLVDITDGSILWIGSGTSKTRRILSTLSFGALGASSGGSVSREDEELFGDVVGGVMGGAATGQPLSPKETERAQRIIKKMCATLPSRLTTEW